jgi:peptidoglycan hydrolase CwlO-like protein
MVKLTNTIIEAAIHGFEAQKKNIDAQIAELRGLLTGASQADEAPAKGKRKKFSAAARKRMQEAQRARWAKIRGESAPAKKAAKPAAKSAKPKGGITAAGRKKLSLAMKARWAARKAAA